MSNKPYRSPLEIHKEQAHLMPFPSLTRRGGLAAPTGGEIGCFVGAIDEEPIPVLYHPASRTVFPVRESK